MQGVRYNITNEALIGAFFLPAGLGNFIGAPLAGRISDKFVTRFRRSRGGIWVPEDRLRGTLIGAAFLVPLSVLFSGLITSLPSEVMPDRIGIVLNLLCLFANGLGVSKYPLSYGEHLLTIPKGRLRLKPLGRILR